MLNCCSHPFGSVGFQTCVPTCVKHVQVDQLGDSLWVREEGGFPFSMLAQKLMCMPGRRPRCGSIVEAECMCGVAAGGFVI